MRLPKKLVDPQKNPVAKPEEIYPDTTEGMALEGAKLQENVEIISRDRGEGVEAPSLSQDVTDSAPGEVHTDEKSKSSEFKCIKRTSTVNSRSAQGVLTIVHSKKSGKRIVVSNSVLMRLGNPKWLIIATNGHEIALTPGADDEMSYLVKNQGLKGVVYSADAVKSLTEEFELDFAQRVSITFCDVEYSIINGVESAIIPVRGTK